MEELRRQRDLAQSQVDALRRKLEEEQVCFFLFSISVVYHLIT